MQTKRTPKFSAQIIVKNTIVATTGFIDVGLL